MIEFLTLWVGLVSGVQTVELRAAKEVAAVAWQLDGEPVAMLNAAPWRVELDLGDGLIPHQLVAVARDDSGRELERIRQWINVTGPADDHGGGQTAVAIRLEAAAAGADNEPAAAAMQSWFVDPAGKPLRVLAVERGPAEVIVVREPAVQVYLELLGKIHASTEPNATPAGRADAVRSAFQLGDGTGIRFLSTSAAPPSRASGARNLFGHSASLPLRQGLVPFILSQSDTGLSERVADAVAIAAASAHGSSRRRAVVLLATARRDQSRYPVAAVREYLARLQVPLLAVTFEATAAAGGWGGWQIESPQQDRRSSVVAATWSGPQIFALAISQLRSNLKHQRIVWIAGRHRPQDVRLSEVASGVVLAGDFSPTLPAAGDVAGNVALAGAGGAS